MTMQCWRIGRKTVLLVALLGTCATCADDSSGRRDFTFAPPPDGVAHRRLNMRSVLNGNNGGEFFLPGV
jgi:hypothetical protein